MDLPSFFLALLALICSASVILLEFENSNKAKRNTRLVGALSLIALLATFTLESLDRQSEARSEIERNQAEIARTQRTIEQIERSLEKIEKLRANVEVVIDPRQAGLGLLAYQRRLERMADRCLRELAPQGPQEGQGVFRVEPTPECLPGREESLARASLSSFFLTLELSRPAAGSPRCGASTQLELSADFLASQAERTLRLQFDPANGVFILEASGLELDPLDSERIGTIVASRDLEGLVMRVGVWSSTLRPDDAAQWARATNLRHLTLRFASARPQTFDLASACLQKEPEGIGPVTPSYCYPLVNLQPQVHCDGRAQEPS